MVRPCHGETEPVPSAPVIIPNDSRGLAVIAVLDRMARTSAASTSPDTQPLEAEQGAEVVPKSGRKRLESKG